MKNINVPSSSAVRDIEMAMPSIARRNPATPPKSVERVSRRPIRTVRSTASVPSSAGMKRQPNGVSPNRYSPRAIVHLPTGGWTTQDGPPVPNTSIVRQSPLPARMMSLAFSTVECS